MGEFIGLIGVMIPVLALSIPIFAIWTAHKHKIAKLQISATASATAEKAAQYSAQVKELESRVRVLERIVTDRGYDIATQIEALRDASEVEKRVNGVPLDTPMEKTR